MAPASLDLAPFGFTATESQAYATLLRLGPSTGYAVAHAARLARANTYGALEGLVARGAAARLPGRPARYRAADPPALLAQLAAQQGAALERLGRALKDVSRPAEPDTRSIEGTRAVANLILQLVVRVAGDLPAEAGPIVTGSADPDTPTVLLIDDAHVISVAGAGDTAAGIWSSHPAVAALARATLRGLA